MLPKWSALAPNRYHVVYFDRGHPRFWNVNSTIRVDIVGVKSYVNNLLNLPCVTIRVSISKLNFVPERIVPGIITVLRNLGSTLLSSHWM